MSESDEQKESKFETFPDTDKLEEGLWKLIQEVQQPLIFPEVPPGYPSREYIKDKEGKFVDIVFTSNSKSVSLKNIIPGAYSIEFTQGEKRGYHHADSDKISVPREDKIESQNTQNLTILHEAGHVAEFDKNKEEYEELTYKAGLHAIKARLAQGVHLKGSEGLHDFAIIIEKEAKEKYPDKIDEIRQNINKAQVDLAKLSTKGDLEKYYEEWSKKSSQIKTQIKILRERRAWGAALQALRQFREKDINLFNGSKEELFNAIKTSLSTYQEAYGNYTTAENKFL